MVTIGTELNRWLRLSKATCASPEFQPDRKAGRFFFGAGKLIRRGLGCQIQVAEARRLIGSYDQARAGRFLIAAVARLQRCTGQIIELTVATSGHLNSHGTGAICRNRAAGERHGSFAHCGLDRSTAGITCAALDHHSLRHGIDQWRHELCGHRVGVLESNGQG
jgi:hypothetical protein